jgi:hypothetical protein
VPHFQILCYSIFKQVSLGTAAAPHREAECTGTSHDSAVFRDKSYRIVMGGGGKWVTEGYLTQLHCMYVTTVLRTAATKE